MVGLTRTGTSSGRIALVLVLVLVFAVVAYILTSPGPGEGNPSIGQSTSGPTTTTNTNPSTGSSTQSTQSSISTPSSQIPFIVNGTSYFATFWGQLGPESVGHGGNGGYVSGPINSSVVGVFVWNSTGPFVIELSNSTNKLFTKTAQQQGNATFCVPETGRVTLTLKNPNVLLNSPPITVTLTLYELDSDVCSP